MEILAIDSSDILARPREVAIGCHVRFVHSVSQAQGRYVIRTKCHPLAGSPMDNNPLTSFFCDMTAIPAELRNQPIAITKEVFGAIQTIRELPNGYAFQLSDTQGMLVKTAEFIDKERLCCPFFSFTVEVAPAGGSLWLQMTGQEGVKPFIQAEIGEAVNETVAKSAGFR